jgi:hypothetical protein
VYKKADTDSSKPATVRTVYKKGATDSSKPATVRTVYKKADTDSSKPAISGCYHDFDFSRNQESASDWPSYL